jgi:DMATS type aromatic prenyltransferase
MQSNFVSRHEIQAETFLSFGGERLRRLCRAVGMRDDEPRVLDDFAWLSRPWNQWKIGKRPRWYPSILSDDHAPFELSAAFAQKETEVQCYWEAQGEAPSMVSNMRTGAALLDQIAARYDLPLARWEAIKDLFLPEVPQGLFTLLFGVTWRRGRAPKFKVYLNPLVRGWDAAPELMREAMTRLGFERAWAADLERRRGRDPSTDELMYLCLDLSQSPEARVKVYRRHYHATVADIASLAGVAKDYRPGDAEKFYGLVGGGHGPFTSKPPITSLTFVQGDDERPGAATLDFPISSYARNDQVASERITRCFAEHGIDPARYWRAVDAIATRPLDRGNGIHAHITRRWVDGAPRLGVYFATEAYPVEMSAWGAQAESSRVPVPVESSRFPAESARIPLSVESSRFPAESARIPPVESGRFPVEPARIPVSAEERQSSAS